MRTRLPAAVAVLTVCSMTGSAQQTRPPAVTGPATFRASVDLVEVNAVVTDQRGRPVPGLLPSDFEILEDRRPQVVAAFAQVERQPIPLDPQSLTAAPVPTDVRSNINADGTAYGVVLDGLHIGRERTDRVRGAVRDFIERGLSSTDFAALVVTGQQTSSVISQQFTTSRPGLLQSLDRFAGTKIIEAPAAGGGRINAEPSPFDGAGSVADPADADRAVRARASLETLRNLSEALSGVRGRRSVIVFVSEGFEYNDADITSGRTAQTVQDGIRSVTEAAARANVTIYAIDPRMLPGATGRGAFGPGVAVAQETLRDIAEGTGGRAALSAAGVSSAFERVTSDARSYYALGYAPDRAGGRYRRIEVRVKRSGLRVWARRGRFAPGEPAPDQPSAPATLREVMASPLPVTAMPFRVFAVPFKDTGQNAAVLVCLEWPADDSFATRGGATPNTVDLDVSAYDERGRPSGGARHAITTSFEPESVDSIRARGLRLMTQIQLAPGRYQLRVSAFEALGGSAGSVMYDLQVPDFSEPTFSISGVTAFVWPERPAQLTSGAPAPLSSVLPWPPTMAREFRQGDEVALFAEVYDTSAPSSPHDLSFRASLESVDGRVMAEDRTDWSSAAPRGHRNEYGVQARLPLKDVPAGLYVIRVEGVAASGGSKPIAAFIPIKVID